VNGPPKPDRIRQPAQRTHARRGSLGRKARLSKPRRTSEGSGSLPTRTTSSPSAEAAISKMNTAEALARFLVALERGGAIIITPEFRARLKAEAAAK
jgi:hypothetical protein